MSAANTPRDFLRLDIGIEGVPLQRLIQAQVNFLGLLREVSSSVVGDTDEVRWVVTEVRAETSTGALAEAVAAATGGIVELARGLGYRVVVTDSTRIIVRIMDSGSQSTPYWRISLANKGSLTAEGQISSDQSLTHFDVDEHSLEQILYVLGKIESG
jgi:hypothetical protein